MEKPTAGNGLPMEIGVSPLPSRSIDEKMPVSVGPYALMMTGVVRHGSSAAASHCSPATMSALSDGPGRDRRRLSRLRVREPKRTIVPLSVEDVARFWSSFHTSRDLAIVGLMLLDGLRSQEVRDLNREDLLLPEAQLRMPGKGNKPRMLPLAPEAVQLLDHYLRLERPDAPTAPLFVSLKGPARGARMTPAGLRSLFRYHRQTTGVKLANPHRFRHTFASDMLRGGVSLPALMRLMGHAHIQTTLIYVHVTPLEVYQQYARAVAQHIRPIPVMPS